MKASELIEQILDEIATRLSHGQRAKLKRQRDKRKHRRKDPKRVKASKKAHKRHKSSFRRGSRTRARRTYRPL